MPHASQRLDLLVLPISMEQPLTSDAEAVIMDRWSVDIRGYSENMGRYIDGGAARVWVDRPGRIVLYANQSGGFRVRCPVSDAILSAEFGRAHRDWKAGGPRTVRCVCGEVHPLESCVLSPPGAFATWAIVFASVNSVVLSERAVADLNECVGPFQTILRRP